MTILSINRNQGKNNPKRTPIIAANWKMNKTVDEALILIDEIVDDLDALDGVETIICPPFVALYSVLDLLEDTTVRLGAQNMYYEDNGAYTGEISPLMLRELCDYVLVGHSERRVYFDETDIIVNLKVKAAIKHDIIPIIAVGESAALRDAGETERLITGQLRAALADVPAPDVSPIVIAYEPLWAIGTGQAATGPLAQEVCGLIRRTLLELYGPEIAGQVRIQYGGSVTAKNIAEFIQQPDIDGALVGGASLKPDEFVAIVAKTLEVSGQK